MQAIIFIGIQATGKSTFYKKYFFNTHVRISMDLLNTRNKENQLLDTCLDLQQSVVIDNTNPTRADRQKYIAKCKAKKYKVIGYYFQSKLEDSLGRNEARLGKEKIDKRGILATYKKLEIPIKEEGFDQLFYVEIAENKFSINQWEDEI